MELNCFAADRLGGGEAEVLIGHEEQERAGAEGEVSVIGGDGAPNPNRPGRRRNSSCAVALENRDQCAGFAHARPDRHRVGRRTPPRGCAWRASQFLSPPLRWRTASQSAARATTRCSIKSY